MKISLTGILEDGTPRRIGADIPEDPRARLTIPRGSDVEVAISVVRPNGSPVQLGVTDEVLFTVKKRPERGLRVARVAAKAGNLATVTLVPADTWNLDPGLYGWDAWLTKDGLRDAIVPLSVLSLLDANISRPFTPPPTPPAQVPYGTFLTPVKIAEQAGAPTPAAGFAFIYPKTDGKLYWLDSSGVEREFAVAEEKLASRLDEVGDLTYLGEAAPGSLDAAAVWRISRMDESGAGDVELRVEWAEGSDAFDQVWDARLGLSYS